jgi:molecular chaperone DnaK (HSP70)
MRLGIDLGTTRTVVVASDRGNFPVVRFEGPDGDLSDHLPTLSAEWEGRLVHGFEAERAAAAGAPALGSWKRLLAHHGPQHRVRIGSLELPLLELATEFLRFVAATLRSGSDLSRARGALPETVVSVPAHSSSSQRFTTLEAFRRAGFPVRALLNEPSAVGLEYAHRYGSTLNRTRDRVAVYDLGGGTFDAALVSLEGETREVIATAGLPDVGGDDFDEALLELALETAGIARERALPVWGPLLRECRRVKESISPGTRRAVLELAALGEAAPGEPVVLLVADYERRILPLVERTLEAFGGVLRPPEGASGAETVEQALTRARVAGVYVVGGASSLPTVARLLREVFGRRVHRSAHASAATAIGLAIAAESHGRRRVRLRERLTRDLAVFRERDAGTAVALDRLFAKGTPMPAREEPALVATRRYRAAHNIGHFRFIEGEDLEAEWQPRGDLSPQADVLFPLAPDLRGGRDLGTVPVERLPGEGHLFEERYQLDASGIVSVTIRDLDDGYSERFRL